MIQALNSQAGAAVGEWAEMITAAEDTLIRQGNSKPTVNRGFEKYFVPVVENRESRSSKD